MPDYSKGKIYKIVNLASNDDCDCYVGSTCDSLSKRFSVHKKDSKREKCKSILLYKKFTDIGVDNFRIVLVEEFPCANSDQLRAREEHHRVDLGAKYNMIRALTTKEDISNDNKQHYQKNKEKICARVKLYRENNKEKVAETDKKYYEENKEKINEYKKGWYDENRDNVLEKARNNYQLNKDKIKEYQKQHYEKNKDKINERKQTYECECGGTYITGGQNRHVKTKKHTEYITLKTV